MRSIGILLLATLFTRAVFATDANSVRAACLQQQYATCMAANPVPSSMAGSSGMDFYCQANNQNNATCQAAVDTFCQQSTTSESLPEGCPVPKFTTAQVAAMLKKSTAPPAPNPSATPGQQATAPDSDLDAAQSDAADCTAKTTNAQTCCGDPASCGGVDSSQQIAKLAAQAQQAYNNGDSQGLKQVCSQAAQAANITTATSNSFTQVCAAQHSGCSVACNSYAAKWKAHAINCTAANGCDPSSLNDLISTMTSNKAACDGLQTAEDAYKQSSLTQASGSGISQYCSQNVAANGTTPGSNSPNPFNNNLAAPPPPVAVANNGLPPNNLGVGSGECGTASNVGSCMNCDDHPEFPSCANRASLASNDGGANSGGGYAGDTGLALPGKTAGGANNANSSVNPMAAAAAYGMAGMMAANTSSGMVAGSPSAPPILYKAPVVAKTGVNTDVLHGERADTFRTVAGTGFEAMAPNNHYNPMPYANSSSSSYVGWDLKKYLPGALGGPHRGIAANGMTNPEIGPMSVDLFQRVSIRMRTICAADELIGCQK